jgi:hypothetical protein
MNPYTTDHPMTLQPSSFDSVAHPWRSFVYTALVTATGFAPLVLGVFIYLAASADEGYTTPPEDQLTWSDLGFGLAESFLLCLILASVGLAAQRLAKRHFIRLRTASA